MIAFTMKQTSTTNSPKSSTSSDYERLLSVAQAAQSAADRAVADLASIKRTMAEAPRVAQLRRDELAKAQQALERAESDLAQAREQLAGKQAEAARLIEVAADAQRALAQALINQDVMPEGATWDARSVLSAAAPAAPAAAPRVTPTPRPAYDPTLGHNRYTPTPAMHPADLHAEVVDYLAERDALCPSCGHSLRGIQTARCPGCKLQLSVNILRSVRASRIEATKAMWIVRILTILSILISAYLAMIVVSRGIPFGCGHGGDCEHFFRKGGFTKLMGIPVAALAIPVHFVLLLATGFIHIGLTDTTRRRAWSIITIAGFIIGIASLWFMAVQFVIVKAICPHCLIVDILGVVIAAIVLMKAPLGRVERLPERAAGPITIPRGKAAMLVGVAAVMVSIGAGVQFATTDRPATAPGKQAGDEQKTKEQDGGLLMTPLEIGAPASKPSTPEKREFAPMPKVDIKPPVIPGTKPKTDNAPGGLLLPGLDINPTPEPAPKAPEAKPKDEAKTGDKPKTKDFDFSGTIPR